LVPESIVNENISADARINALRGMGVAGAANAAAAAGYAAVTERYRELYWSVPGPQLYEAACGHVRLGVGLLQAGGGSAARAADLADAVARSAMLAGRIAFFDLQAPEDSAWYYEIGVAAAHEAGDPALAAAVLAHHAFIPAYAGRREPARALIEQAQAMINPDFSALQKSWLWAVASEIEAKLGAGQAAVTAAGRAQEALGQDPTGVTEGSDTARMSDDVNTQGTIDNTRSDRGDAGRTTAGTEIATDGEIPGWLDFFDGGRLAGFLGFAHLSAGAPEPAYAALRQSLDALPAAAVKQQAVVLADLAAAALATNEVEHCTSLLDQALGIVTDHWYATAMRRIQGVHSTLVPFKSVRMVREFDERLAVFRDALPESP
jgi:tetratricopeptide (TPR) repeat protein